LSQNTTTQKVMTLTLEEVDREKQESEHTLVTDTIPTKEDLFDRYVESYKVLDGLRAMVVPTEDADLEIPSNDDVQLFHLIELSLNPDHVHELYGESKSFSIPQFHSTCMLSTLYVRVFETPIEFDNIEMCYDSDFRCTVLGSSVCLNGDLDIEYYKRRCKMTDTDDYEFLAVHAGAFGRRMILLMHIKEMLKQGKMAMQPFPSKKRARIE
jgi:hypothetical protein